MSGRERIEENLRVNAGETADLAGRSSTWAGGGEFANLAASEANRSQAAREVYARGSADLADLQGLLKADGNSALLVVFEGLGGAGRHSTIEQLTLGLNRHDAHVESHRRPSDADRAYTFLSRAMQTAPRRGSITILDGSYYADVVAARLDSNWLDQRPLRAAGPGPEYWADRFDDINAFERYLDRNGTKVVKFFLNVSAEEQRVRLLSRLDDSDIAWATIADHVTERARRSDFLQAFEDAITATSTKWAPWYVIPADDRGIADAFVVSVIVDAVRELDLHRPTPSEDERRAHAEVRRQLQAGADAPVATDRPTTLDAS